ncbi:MAG: MoxR family ATPase [Oscillospiraceae bacterium]
MEDTTIKQLTQRIQTNIGEVIIGKDDVIRKLLVGILCGGHILLEDVPGTGKTSLAKALAKSVGCMFKRVQFTPDLLPSDIIGMNYYQQKQEVFLLRQGPVFTNILLADEINRATPRTQSSLLECMEEHQVTIDGTTYSLEEPFIVIATQNPIETQGTFPLPEAQLDRFFIRLAVGYPSNESEQDILKRYILQSPLAKIGTVVSKEELIEAKRMVRNVAVSNAVREYIIAIVDATRNNVQIKLGVSPRGSLALMRASQGFAAIEGRDYVLPDDVKTMAIDVFSHRIICHGSNVLRQETISADIIQQILEQVEVPIP